MGTIVFTSTQLERLVNLSKVTKTKACSCRIIPLSQLLITSGLSEEKRASSGVIAHGNVKRARKDQTNSIPEPEPLLLLLEANYVKCKGSNEAQVTTVSLLFFYKQ